jgi:hypothetical protein
MFAYKGAAKEGTKPGHENISGVSLCTATVRMAGRAADALEDDVDELLEDDVDELLEDDVDELLEDDVDELLEDDVDVLLCSSIVSRSCRDNSCVGPPSGAGGLDCSTSCSAKGETSADAMDW